MSSDFLRHRAGPLTLDEVRELVRRKAPSFWQGHPIPPELRLDDAGIGFDSVSLFELLLDCERELGVTLPPDLLLDDALTVGALHEKLTRLETAAG